MNGDLIRHARGTGPSPTGCSPTAPESTTALVRELKRTVKVHTALFSGRGIADPDTGTAVERGEVPHFELDDVLRVGRAPAAG